MNTVSLTPQEVLVVLFSGVLDLPGTSPIVVCKVEPLGSAPVLRITWDSLEGKWQVEQIMEKEQRNGQSRAVLEDRLDPRSSSTLGLADPPL